MPERERFNAPPAPKPVSSICKIGPRFVEGSLGLSEIGKFTLPSCWHPKTNMEPMAGIEPATAGLRNRCSTTELHWPPTAHRQYRQQTLGRKRICAFGSVPPVITFMLPSLLVCHTDVPHLQICRDNHRS